jgi:serine/threonine protein kinase
VSDEIPPVPGGFTVGSQIAGYRLEEQIGRGGMAVVFRAHDSRLDRRVALKILAPELARDEAFRQRFIRESRAAAAVDHPHIIPVFEAGEAAGVLFIAMRYVQGGDVRTLLDEEGTQTPARVVGIVTQVASALDAAHSHGLVHRDVKPANMLLDSTAGSGRPDHVYLSDFGLSKQSLSSSGLTGTGQFLGTLDYVAPEQIEGRPVDGRTDLYALAGAAFEMLGGVPPFKRDQGLAVLWAQISEQPPPLTQRRPDLPPAVDQVMAKALAKTPRDRYSHCLDFAAALRESCGLRPEDSSDPGGPAQPVAGGPSARPRQPTEVAAPSGPAGQPAPPRQPTEVAMPSGPAAPPRPPTEVAAPSGPAGQPAPPRQPTEVAAPSGPAAGPAPAEEAAAARSAELSGPPTEAARIPGAKGSTKPGLTEPAPPGGTAAPGGARGGYGPVPGFGPPADPGQASGYRPPPRPWYRSRGVVALAAAAVVVILLGGGYFLIGGGSGTGTGTGGGGGAPPLKLPGCTTATASARTLSNVTSSSVKLGRKPFAVMVTPDKKFTFVTIGGALAVLSNGPVHLNGHGLAPKLLHTLQLPGASKGMAITDDGKYLLIAADGGAKVLDVAAAEQGNAVVVGTLNSPGGRGAVQVSLSPDNQFAFVTRQTSGGMAVFNLGQALANGFAPSSFVGLVPTGEEPVGVAVSSDPAHKWLYVTSMRQVGAPNPSQGFVSVVDRHTAEVNPAKAVVKNVTAGCSPVRVMTNADGSVVWVTVRESDSLLGFSAPKMRKDPDHSLIARVDVGEGPIGMTFVKNGREIVVADSNLKSLPNVQPDISVVSVSKALHHQPALLGLVKSGELPRQFYAQEKRLLVTNFGSGQLQNILIPDLP